MNRFFAFAFACIILLAACTGLPTENPDAPELLTPIAAHPDFAFVTRGQVAEIERIPGLVRMSSVPLHFGPIAGNFGKFHVQEGDFVQEGQLLAQLDTSHVQEQIYQQTERIALMRRNFASDNTASRLSIDILIIEHSILLRRAGETRIDSYVAQADRKELEIDRARLELQMAYERQRFDLNREENRLRELQAQLESLKMYAPFDGTVVRTISRGWVSSFYAVIFIAPVNQVLFVEHIGIMPVQVFGDIRIRGFYNGNFYDLVRVSLTREQLIDYRNLGLTDPLRFHFGSAEPPALGTLVPIYIYRQWEEDVLRIPRNAMLASPQYGFFVYRLINGQMVKTQISIGAITSTYVAVHGGLIEGEVVHVR